MPRSRIEAMLSVEKAAGDAESGELSDDGQPIHDGTVGNPVSDEPSPDVEAERLDLWKTIEKTVAKLSPELARAVHECLLNGKSYDDLAKELGISARTVRRQVERAYQAIQRELKDRHGDP